MKVKTKRDRARRKNRHIVQILLALLNAPINVTNVIGFFIPHDFHVNYRIKVNNIVQHFFYWFYRVHIFSYFSSLHLTLLTSDLYFLHNFGSFGRSGGCTAVCRIKQEPHFGRNNLAGGHRAGLRRHERRVRCMGARGCAGTNPTTCAFPSLCASKALLPWSPYRSEGHRSHKEIIFLYCAIVTYFNMYNTWPFLLICCTEIILRSFQNRSLI